MDLNEYMERERFSEAVYITRPMMPTQVEYHSFLSKIWETLWLTNEAHWHQQFTSALKKYLNVSELVLFCNGTIALLIALKILDIEEGEVITTPFTFPATPHIICWNGLKPVFCDIQAGGYNLDPQKVEEYITPNTKAILPVHVYGIPCDVDGFSALSRKYSIPIIYDSAHTFGCWYRGRSLCDYGDLSVLSFHATKLFTTAEGGALICHKPEQAQMAYFMKNFGIADEETVVGVGINGKMNELSSAFGLASLPKVTEEISKRKSLYKLYCEQLNDCMGIQTVSEPKDCDWNYAYFPIEVNKAEYGISRDELYKRLRLCNVIARKYFYPLCNRIPYYAQRTDIPKIPTPNADKTAEQVLCLPMYGSLPHEYVIKICEMIKTFPKWADA
ncbi:MAG TPA: DegT/DnrJ/EryC1/StrS family aminotransferase [Candidatus Hydrogenedens sp.]|nr:DegT/DnrJ/EryC1/StrS family aminotransferase [Candidatus Hydrogenedens sp.]